MTSNVRRGLARPLPRGRSSRWVAALAIVCSVVLAGGPGAWAGRPPGGPASGAAPLGQRTAPSLSGSFSGIASADGIQVSLQVPGFLVVENFLDGGGPSAQASLDSLGTSKAFASAPYPGETLVALPGLLSILTGKSFPSYPFYISTSHPTSPDDRIDQPGYHLAAHSDAVESSASARAGEEAASGSPSGSLSTASVSVRPDGTLVSRSGTRTELVLGTLRLSGLEATASVEQGPGGDVRRTSSLKVGHLSVAGTPVGVTDRGLVVGGSALPLDGAAAVTEFSQGETTVRFLPANETADSVLSSGLVVTTSLQLPVRTSLQLPVLNYPVDVGITLGRAFAMGSASAFPSFSSAPLVPIGGPAGIAGGLPATAGGEVADGTPAVAGEQAQAPAGTPRRILQRFRMIASKWAFYPTLFLAALVLLAASLGSRARKEGRAWSS